MTRIGRRFEELAGQPAFIPFLTAGDPDLPKSLEILKAVADAGADILELGVPFSDPMADGVAVQASSQRALLHHVTLSDVLDLVREFRRTHDTPLLTMTYTNPALQYGLERFARDAVAAGLDGAILTDLTPEEAGEWKTIADRTGLDTIFLLAPTSTDERMNLVARMSSGFVYCISSLGVTGMRTKVWEGLGDLVKRIKRQTDRPVCVGFGISTAEHVREVGRLADGVVVGSAMVHVVAQNLDAPDLPERVAAKVRELRSGLAQGTG
ncbi:MAG: tryptophan synthase subunit alpha [Armatimonadetes bacterium]|nr:tryptophan synthase subunit alpha [Armatimonadota bacterium]